MINRRAEGSYYEDMAARILEEIGFQVLKRNIYTGVGELDILAKKDGVLHFFEVRFRKTLSAKESLAAFKYERMKRTMYYLIKKYHLHGRTKLGFVAITEMRISDCAENMDSVGSDPSCILRIVRHEEKCCRVEIFPSVMFD